MANTPKFPYGGQPKPYRSGNPVFKNPLTLPSTKRPRVNPEGPGVNQQAGRAADELRRKQQSASGSNRLQAQNNAYKDALMRAQRNRGGGAPKKVYPEDQPKSAAQIRALRKAAG